MTTSYGKLEAGGFVPSVPESLQAMLGGSPILQSGWEGLRNTTAGKHLADAADRPEDELKRSYARLFMGRGGPADAEAVTQDLLQQTLRRVMFMPTKETAVEQHLPYFLERHGQNSFVIYVLSMIEMGNNLPAPGEKKPGKKTAAKKRK